MSSWGYVVVGYLLTAGGLAVFVVTTERRIAALRRRLQRRGKAR
jgi:hypothetical protein